jgi:outer membrane protein assembly factor BamB
VNSARRAWLVSAGVAGLFLFIVGVTIIVTHLISRTGDPLQSTEFIAAKEQLRANPKDEKLKEQIRKLDLQLRSSYFRQLAIKRNGVWFLLGGGMLLVVATTQLVRFGTRLPNPHPRANAASEAARATRLGRWAVTASGFVIASGLLALALGTRSALPTHKADLLKLVGGSLEPTTPGPADFASEDELQRNWPRFRGFEGASVAPTNNFPLRWDATSGENVLWRIPAPAPGYSSPIVWNGRVFFSGVEGRQGEVLCLDGNTGKLLWRQPVNAAPALTAEKEVPDSNVLAAATMATDGRRVYAIFGGGELGAFSFDGKLLWSKSLGVPDNQYGHASSLAAWRDTLVVQMDQGEAKSARSRLYAFDGRTGQIRWQRSRNVPSSWASPIVIEAAGKTQIITLADPWVIAYSANDGVELWRADCLHGEVLPSPIFAGGLVIVASPADRLIALRPDGAGDVTKTHVAWTSEENVPDIASPVSNGELVFAIMTGGLLTCFDVKTGAKQWEHDFEMESYASPSIAGGMLYLVGLKGDVAIVEPARQFKEIFRTKTGDEFQASAAFADGRIYLRGKTNVVCLGARMQQVKAD